MIRIAGILLFTLFPGFSQKNFIDWDAGRKLGWYDFQGSPDPGNSNAALTSSNINFNFGYGSRGFTYSIRCRFDKKLSWARIKNDHILAHEQGHFDIAEIFARKLSRALKEYRYNEKTVASDVNSLYRYLMEEHHQMQDQYDRETDHSRNFALQETWHRKIQAGLQNLEPWSNYH